MKNLFARKILIGALACYLLCGGEIFGLQKDHLSQDGPVASIETSVAEESHYGDFERKFGFKLLTETIKDSDGQGNQIVAPYGLFDCLHFLSGVTQGPSRKELRASLFESDSQLEQLLSESVGLRKTLQPQEGKPAPPLVAKNFLLYDQAYTLINNGQQGPLELFGVNALPIDWAQKLSVDSVAKTVEATFQKIASGRMGEFNYEPPELDAGSLVFLNLCYFKDRWYKPFDPGETQSGIFHLADGKQSTVEFINGSGRSGKWLENQFFKLVEIPYNSTTREISMVLVLPNKDVSDGKVIEALEGLRCLAAVSKRPQWKAPSIKYDIKVPKFKIKKQTELVDFCQSIGVKSIFGAEAGIGRNLFGKELGLSVSRIQQDAFIQFDETGTEASAKTEMAMEILSAPPGIKVKNKEFFADRPFLFFIVDQQGMMYFAGKVNRPVWE